MESHSPNIKKGKAFPWVFLWTTDRGHLVRTFFKEKALLQLGV